MWEKMVLVGYFLVQSVDYDDGHYNILLAQQHEVGGQSATNMIAAYSKDKNEFKEGTTIYLKMEGECSRVYEILEGNGKRGSGWCAEDDWYLNGRPWICNSSKIEVIND